MANRSAAGSRLIERRTVLKVTAGRMLRTAADQLGTPPRLAS